MEEHFLRSFSSEEDTSVEQRRCWDSTSKESLGLSSKVSPLIGAMALVKPVEESGSWFASIATVAIKSLPKKMMMMMVMVATTIVVPTVMRMD